MTLRAKRSGAQRGSATLLAAVLWLLIPGVALAQDKPEPRTALFSWNSARSELYAHFSFRDVVDANLLKKLSRGLPTTIVFTGLVFRAGSPQPVSSTLQSCKVTWHVWEEMYRVELTRPNTAQPRRYWTPTVNGVLRRCVEARNLLVADVTQVRPGAAVYLKGKVQINPISPELLKKIKRWISRPSRTATVSPGSALFSTFTGLFMQRIGDAEQTHVLVTKVSIPSVRPPDE